MRRCVAMGYGGYYMHNGYGMGWVGWILMTALFLLLATALAVGIVVLLRASRRNGSPSEHEGDGRPPADRMLDERFARGEIDEEEYRRRREVLRTP
jgi:putative membrane protein